MNFFFASMRGPVPLAEPNLPGGCYVGGAITKVWFNPNGDWDQYRRNKGDERNMICHYVEISKPRNLLATISKRLIENILFLIFQVPSTGVSKLLMFVRNVLFNH